MNTNQTPAGELKIETPEGADRFLRTECVDAHGEQWLRFYYTERRYGQDIEVEVLRTRLADFRRW